MTERDERGWLIVRGGVSGFAQEITAGEHTLTADEPVALGGGDTGPSPYDYLLTALGTCTSMTIGMYARRKAWPIERITVKLRHSKIHAEDCVHCDKKDTKLDRIEVEIDVEGTLDDEQRQKLLWIAGRCPVYRTLTSEIVIDEKLLP